MSQLTIQRMTQPTQFLAAVEMQKLYWGQDARNLVPAHMLDSLAHYGGHLLGAYLDNALVGILMGFVGSDASPAADNLLIMSKRMLVLPGHRGRGIGYRLKLAQRDIAIRQGITRVAWTFEPLLAPNAHLNLRKLGALVTGYAEDYFEYAGAEALSGDRLIAQWHVASERVAACISGAANHPSLDDYVSDGASLANPADLTGEHALPGDATLDYAAGSALVEIPADIDALPADMARSWRRHIRGVLAPLLRREFIISDFVSANMDGRRRSFYYLCRDRERN